MKDKVNLKYYIKTGVIVLFVILLAIFSLQNTEMTIVKLWFWEIHMPLTLLIIFCVAFGLAIGYILQIFVPFRKNDKTSTKQ